MRIEAEVDLPSPQTLYRAMSIIFDDCRFLDFHLLVGLVAED
jgi:hypothetical protein